MDEETILKIEAIVALRNIHHSLINIGDGFAFSVCLPSAYKFRNELAIAIEKLIKEVKKD